MPTTSREGSQTSRRSRADEPGICYRTSRQTGNRAHPWYGPGLAGSTDRIVTDDMDDDSAHQFAHRLDSLIRSSGKSAPQIAAEIRARAEGDISLSDSYFWQLRTGKKDPRLAVVRNIADYFDVPASYFLDEVVDDTDEAVTKQRASAGEKQVRNIAARARGLKLGTLQRITEIVEDARILDGLNGISDKHAKDANIS